MGEEFVYPPDVIRRVTELDPRVRWWVYHTERDEKVCAACAVFEGRVAALETAYAERMIPPLHPNCRCRLVVAAGGLWAEDAGFRSMNAELAALSLRLKITFTSDLRGLLLLFQEIRRALQQDVEAGAGAVP